MSALSQASHAAYAAVKSANSGSAAAGASPAAAAGGGFESGNSQSAYAALKAASVHPHLGDSGATAGSGPAHLIRPSATGFSPYFAAAGAAASSPRYASPPLPSSGADPMLNLGSPIPDYRTGAYQQQQHYEAIHHDVPTAQSPSSSPVRIFTILDVATNPISKSRTSVSLEGYHRH